MFEILIYCDALIASSDSSDAKLHDNWQAFESHTDDQSDDTRDDYTYFFNLCAPVVGTSHLKGQIAPRISYFGNDIGVIQVRLHSYTL